MNPLPPEALAEPPRVVSRAPMFSETISVKDVTTGDAVIYRLVILWTTSALQARPIVAVEATTEDASIAKTAKVLSAAVVAVVPVVVETTAKTL